MGKIEDNSLHLLGSRKHRTAVPGGQRIEPSLHHLGFLAVGDSHSTAGHGGAVQQSL
jgi:hypothetical protein